MKILLFLFIFQCAISVAFCQTPEIHFDRISVEQGLNEQAISCIIQDHSGFIWLSAGNGLYKYDGYTFTLYKNQLFCKNCPFSGFGDISWILEDKLGILWIESVSGITLFDPVKEKSVVLKSFPADSASSTYAILKLPMIKDSRGNIWAANKSGLLKVSNKINIKLPVTKETLFNASLESVFTVEVINLSGDKYSLKNTVQSIYEDLDGNIWIGTLDGLYILKKGGTNFFRLDEGTDQKTRLICPAVFNILQANEDEFWIATAEGLNRLTNVRNALRASTPDKSKLVFTKYLDKSGQEIRLLHKDRKNNLLIGTAFDLLKLKKNRDEVDYSFVSLFQNLTEPTDYGYVLGVNDLLEDRTGMIWTGLSYYGIRRFNLEQSQFISYKKIITDNFSNTDISPVYEDNQGNLWIGSYGGGLYKIQQGNKKVIHYNVAPLGNLVNTIYETSPGILLLGGMGILEFNSKSGKFLNLLTDTRTARNLRNTNVCDILQDQDHVFIGTFSGLFVLDLKTKQLLQYTFNKNDSVIDYENTIFSLLKSKEGELLACSYKSGIHKIACNFENRSLLLLPFKSKSQHNSSVICRDKNILFQDSHGLIWIGNDRGLHSINSETGEVKTYRLFENTDHPFVRSILEDDHDNLWLGTRFGLCRFNLKTSQVKVFTSEDGVPILIHGFHAYKNKQGRMYFGGIGGFYSFHPDSLKTNDSIPPIVITDFRLFNKSVNVDTIQGAILRKNISYAKLIELRHNQNDLSFEFAALDYNHPLKNKFAYKLEGYQDKWIETDAKNRVASYTNLDPGTYIFRVKGSNNDGVWNETGASLTIIIHKPWWVTLFAWIVYIFIFVATVGGFIRWRIWHFKKEKADLEILVKARTHQLEEQKEEILSQRDMLENQNQKITELDELKSKFFTNVSHEFRTPLSLIQSPVEELLDDPHRNEKERRKLNMINRNAQRLLSFVNQLLDISKIDASSMKLELVEANVMRYLYVIAGSFTSLAETRSIHYILHFTDEKIISWFDADKLEKIVVNLLSNAFKFTPEGGDIIFDAGYKNLDNPKVDQYLEFSVKDSGTGIPADSLEKIFDRFYQVESSVKKEGSGTGIGLSLARDMARLMHGDIAVESEICKGSVFSVQIPLGKDHLDGSEYNLLKTIPALYSLQHEYQEEQTEIFTPVQEEKFRDEKPVMLIVEDNRDIRMQLADNFNLEYNIFEAIDGVSGLKKGTELIPEIIITDLMMPRMNGMELCEKLKNDERTSHIPVIMLTAKDTSEDKINGLRTGADDYIPKPFHMAELKARVANLLEQRRKLRERFSREITLEPSEISVTPLDEKFLNRAIAMVEKHLGEEDFDLPEFRAEMNMSRSTLFRKLQALTGQSPTEFIRTIRLKRAASLLKQHFGNVTQVSLEVGFNNLSYFNRSFKKLYGVSPLEYSRQ